MATRWTRCRPRSSFTALADEADAAQRALCRRLGDLWLPGGRGAGQGAPLHLRECRGQLVSGGVWQGTWVGGGWWGVRVWWCWYWGGVGGLSCPVGLKYGPRSMPACLQLLACTPSAPRACLAPRPVAALTTQRPTRTAGLRRSWGRPSRYYWLLWPVWPSATGLQAI